MNAAVCKPVGESDVLDMRRPSELVASDHI
jgi:hypothetical protein